MPKSYHFNFELCIISYGPLSKVINWALKREHNKHNLRIKEEGSSQGSCLGLFCRKCVVINLSIFSAMGSSRKLTRISLSNEWARKRNSFTAYVTLWHFFPMPLWILYCLITEQEINNIWFNQWMNHTCPCPTFLPQLYGKQQRRQCLWRLLLYVTFWIPPRRQPAIKLKEAKNF